MPVTIDQVVSESGGWFKDADQVIRAASVLSGANVCPRCMLRYLQVGVGPIYLDNPSFGLDYTTKPCSVCLGILNPQILEQIASDFKEQGYDSDSVVISIELPKGVYVRRRAMQIFTQRNLPNLNLSVDTDIKETFKYMLSQHLVRQCKVAFDLDSDTQIEVSFNHEASATDHQFLMDREGSSIQIKTFRKRGVYHTTGDSRSAIVGEIDACGDEDFAAGYPCPPPAVESNAEIGSLVIKRKPLFIGGRYLKLERHISQTPFVIEGRRVTEHSVSELIGEPIKELTHCDQYNMVGSGREDADVRMLGDGRPFYIECINPRIVKISQEQIQAVSDRLEQDKSPVQVRRLQLIRSEDTSIIKEGEEHKTKHYCALVWLASPLSKGKLEEVNGKGSQEIVLQQKTPIRVLHRRAPLTRPKKLLSLNLEHIRDHFYKLRVESEAGTYIKEFVHGDLGRTTPSLADLAGTTADILELDVENVSLDFPPKI